MIRRIPALLLIALLILSNTALAANWVYLQRLEGTRYGACTEYFDADSVIKDGDKGAYWTLWVVDRNPPPGYPKILLWKNEVLLSTPMQKRYLEAYQYDIAGDAAVINNFFYLKPFDFFPIEPDSMEEAFIKQIMQSAKIGQESDAAQPDHLTVPSPKWYGSVEFAECNLFWDIHSIVAWPWEKPTTVQITVKWVWNEQGNEARKAVLSAQSQRSKGYDDLSYTMVTYQFLTNENKMRIMSMVDCSNDNSRRALYIGSEEWQDIAIGSKDERARQIALNWINSSETAGAE